MLFNSNGGIHPVGDNAFENFHEYCFIRTPEAIYYTMDGDTKRGVFKKDIGDVFPYRTAKIVATIWDAGSVGFGGFRSFGRFRTLADLRTISFLTFPEQRRRFFVEWGPTNWTFPSNREF